MVILFLFGLRRLVNMDIGLVLRASKTMTRQCVLQG